MELEHRRRAIESRRLREAIERKLIIVYEISLRLGAVVVVIDVTIEALQAVEVRMIACQDEVQPIATAM